MAAVCDLYVCFFPITSKVLTVHFDECFVAATITPVQIKTVLIILLIVFS